MDMDAEAAVLSAVMLDPSAFDKVQDVLTRDAFYAGRHGWIYEACVELRSCGSPCDVVTVGTWLKNRDRIAQVGGMSYLTELLNAAPAVANVRAYAKIVRDKAALRGLISKCQTMAASGYGDIHDAREFIATAEAEIHDATAILRSGQTDTFQHVSVPTRRAFEQVRDANEAGGISGTRTGLTQLDKMLGGLHPGKLYVVAGRPGMGKSSLAFNIGANVGAQGIGVFGQSLEMPADELALRLVSGAARVNGAKVHAGVKLTDGDWKRMTSAAVDVARMPMWLDDRGDADLAHIRSGTRRAETAAAVTKYNAKLGLVIVDYLQLAHSGKRGRRDQNREQEVAEISRGLKTLAKDHNLPVIALSQLNRSCESRADKRPTLGDLRESGAIEQDADVIIFVYRDKVYDSESEAGNTAELIVAKHRGGPTGMVTAYFDETTTTFRDLEPAFGTVWDPGDDRRAGVDP